MAWRLTAIKGNMRQRSGSSKKKLIKERARKLRKQGYKVTIYEVKDRNKGRGK